jgi:uncharacterized protein (DUF1810 family)
MVDSPNRHTLDDPFHLDRFVRAQEPVYDRAREELRRGHKETHWMWFVFPQLEGLGSSPTSRFYGISGPDEALAYLRHPVLGQRLLECATTLLQIDGRSARDILGTPDDLKLHSSATLFAYVSDADSPFEQLLEKYFRGTRDDRTLRLLVSST